jgi:hypothetical protein
MNMLVWKTERNKAKLLMMTVAYRSESYLFSYLVVLSASLDVEKRETKSLRKIIVRLHLTFDNCNL